MVDYQWRAEMYVALSGPKGHESVTIREDYTNVDGKKKTRILETLYVNLVEIIQKHILRL